jgi:hypothetical protein
MEKRSFRTATDSFVVLPSDFLQLKSFQIQNRVSPSNFTLTQLDKNKDSQELSFSITGCQLEIRPTIQFDDPVELEINYYAKVPEILDENLVIDPNDYPNGTVLSNYPHLYLYGCMIEISLWTQDDARIKLWQSRFEQEIVFAHEATEMYLRNGAPLAVRS